jgi:hypothetical protein
MDRIIRNGNLITMDTTGSRAPAVVVKRGKVSLMAERGWKMKGNHRKLCGDVAQSNRRRRLSFRYFSGILLVLTVVFAVQAEETVQDPHARDPAGNGVDHSEFDRLLGKYVDDQGFVNYRKWKKLDEETLRKYLINIDKQQVESLGGSEALAFWINVYNALTVQGILEFYPLQSIRDKASRILGFNIWDDYPVTVRGKAYSLNDIEHKILRKMGEPRIHFAIVCASVGCPKLRREAYDGAKLDFQLEDQARSFFAQPRNLKIDRRTDTVYLSRILDWFGEDFGGSDRAKLDYVSRYVAEERDRAYLREGGPRVKYLEYDWTLNEMK